MSDIKRAVWPVLVLVLLSLHFWFPDVPSGSRQDTFSTAGEGYKALYRLLSSFHLTYRNYDPLKDVVQHVPTGSTLVILGPQRPPSAGEWTALKGWVARGGNLLYAPENADTEELKAIGIELSPLMMEDDDTPQVSFDPPLLKQKFTWWSNHSISADNSWTTNVTVRGTTQAVSKRYGAGKLVICATPDPFSNQALTYKDQSVLVHALVRECAPSTGIGFVAIDESLNVTGTPQVVGVLLNPPLRAICIQLLLLTALFGWWGSQRFGPLLPQTDPPRHDIVDHTNTVGGLYYRAHDGVGALKRYLKQLGTEWKLKAFKGNEERVLAPVARRLGKSVTDIKLIILAAYRAARQKDLDRRAAAAHIRQLAELRQDKRPGTSSTGSDSDGVNASAS